MYKKYLPLIAVLAAATLLWFIKSKQRGTYPEKTQVVIPAADQGEFNRHITHISYSKHARCRMDCRHIDESEVKEILDKGEINYSKIENDDRGKTYPLEGITHDHQHVRIVFAPKKEELVVVTVIDLDTEWQCDCK